MGLISFPIVKPFKEAGLRQTRSRTEYFICTTISRYLRNAYKVDLLQTNVFTETLALPWYIHCAAKSCRPALRHSKISLSRAVRTAVLFCVVLLYAWRRTNEQMTDACAMMAFFRWYKTSEKAVSDHSTLTVPQSKEILDDDPSAKAVTITNYCHSHTPLLGKAGASATRNCPSLVIVL